MEFWDVGDFVELVKFYDEEGVDELVFLDIFVFYEGCKMMVYVVEEVVF